MIPETSTTPCHLPIRAASGVGGNGRDGQFANLVSCAREEPINCDITQV